MDHGRGNINPEDSRPSCGKSSRPRETQPFAATIASASMRGLQSDIEENGTQENMLSAAMCAGMRPGMGLSHSDVQ